MLIQVKMYHCDEAIYEVGVFPQRVGVWPFRVKLMKSFQFYDITHFTTKISAYQEFDVCLVMG